MAEHSAIEWTDATWNPITGCTLVSEGCRHCYAALLAATRLKGHPSRAGLARINAAGEAKFTGEVRFNEQWLDQPLRWKRPRRIFVCAHGDLFHASVPDEWIEKVFAVMAMCPQHTFQVLTKRPERAACYDERSGHVRDVCYRPERYFSPVGDPTPGRVSKWPDRWPGWPLPNVWLGTSCEDQATADERIPHLLDTPAAVRFVSLEPLLGPIELWRFDEDQGALRGCAVVISGGVSASTHNDPPEGYDDSYPGLDWVIVGGESGRGARPMHPDWVRSIRDQCQAAGVPFFFKQWGEWAPHQPRARGDLGADVRAGRVTIVHQNGMTDVEVSNSTGGWSTLPGSRYVVHVGKKRAGRLLDGRTWDQMPAEPSD